MIKSCKYCLSQTHLCPRCEGSVLVRRITEVVHAEVHSTSLILCTNVQCQNYGIFKIQTVESVVPYICDSCTELLKEQNPRKELSA